MASRLTRFQVGQGELSRIKSVQRQRSRTKEADLQMTGAWEDFSIERSGCSFEGDRGTEVVSSGRVAMWWAIVGNSGQ